MIVFLLILTIVATPWFFGGVQGYVPSVLLAVCGLLMLFDVVRSLRTRADGLGANGVMPTAFWPLLAGIVLGLLQLLPLNMDGAAKFASGTLRWHEDVRYQTEGLSEPLIDSRRIPRTLYPPTTRENVALLLLVTGVFWLSARNLSDDRNVAAFFVAVTVCGVVLALFGLVQRFTWNGKMYWTVPLSMGGNPFGPFINRNNGGGFLNLCLAVGLGLYAWFLSRGNEYGDDETVRRRRESATRRGESGRRGSGKGHRNFGRERQSSIGATHIWVVAALIFVAGAIVASASRGSILSLVFAAAVCAAVMMLQRGRRMQAVGIVAASAVALGLVVWLGQFSEVQSRFSDLAGSEIENDTRLLNWAEATRSVPDFWFLGSGLNTYRFVCPPFQERLNTLLHYYAENQYVQTLVDGGVVALSLLLITISLVTAAIYRLYRIGGRVNTAVATMGTFGLASQVVGGTFDFGLYLPANSMLLAAICGVVVGRAAQQRGEGRLEWLFGLTLHPVTIVSLSVVLAIGLGFGAVEMYRAAVVEQSVMQGVRGEIERERSDQALVAQINTANRAVGRRVDDAEGHRVLADLWMQRHRVAFFQGQRQSQPWLAEDELWQASSLLAINNSIREAPPDKRAAALTELRAASKTLLQPAWEHARAAQRACPWQPQTYLTLAALAPLVGEPVDTSEHLAKARQFAGGDPSLWYRIGLLERVAGRDGLAMDSWQRCLELSRGYEAMVLSELVDSASGEVLDRVFPTDLPTRLRVVTRLSKSYSSLARSLADISLAGDTQINVDDSVESVAAEAGLLGTVGRHADAAARWQQVVAKRDAPAEWHLGLVNSLLEIGKTSQAYDASIAGLKAYPDHADLEAVRTVAKKRLTSAE